MNRRKTRLIIPKHIRAVKDPEISRRKMLEYLRRFTSSELREMIRKSSSVETRSALEETFVTMMSLVRIEKAKKKKIH